MEHLMEDYYQNLINNVLRTQIVRDLELDAEFLNIMREDKCMSEYMEEQVKIKLREGRMAGVSEFLTRLKSRPQKAFDQFIKALYATHQQHLIDLIDQKLHENHMPYSDFDYTDSAKEFEEIVNTVVDGNKSLEDLFIVSMNERERSRPVADCYRPANDGKQQGRVIIVNNKNFYKLKIRNGSEHDVENLSNLFKNQYHFDVRVEQDLNKEAMIKYLEEQREDLKNIDLLIVILMSHGQDNGVLGTDGEAMKIHPDVTSMFSDEKCSEMKGKPKLFFIQACQDAPTDGKAPDDEDWHLGPDTYVAMATVEGSKSFRSSGGGSWFIRAVLCIFAKYSHVHHVVTLMEKVSSVVSCLKGKENGEDVIQLSKRICNLSKPCYIFS